MEFSDAVYDRVKWVARYLLPALGTLYCALASIWGFPYAEEIVGTISAVDVFLGVLLGISSSNYSGDGTLTVDPNDDSNSSFELNKQLSDFAGQKAAHFRVETVDSSNNSIDTENTAE